MKKTLIFFGAVLLVTVQSWGEMVSYVDEKSETQMTNATIIATSDSRVTWTAGWYAVTNDVTISGGADCSGAVKLILADGAKLTINGVAEDNAGIAVTGDGNSFAIYGQTNGTGELDVAGGSQGAGIGGGYNGDGANITINGGTVTAKGGSWCAGAGIGGGSRGDGANITINGGTVMAKGGDQSAGIGGGYEGNGTNITINGGTVTAKGGQSGAGIGGGVGGNGGGSGSDITINGGVVTATGGSQGAGIGSGGWLGKASNITINGGVVTATGGSYGAGIGGGGGRSASDITINGGTVTATGGEESGDYGSGIGGGYNGTGSAIYVKEGVVVWAGSSPNPTEIIPFVSPTTDIASSLAGKRYAVADRPSSVSVTYVDEWGEQQTTNACILFTRDSRATWNAGWYVVTNDATITGGAVCSGAVKLILADTGKLTINGVAEEKAGIGVTGNGNSFMVYGQANDTGRLEVTGGTAAAGIGGDKYCASGSTGAGSNITINGGTVTAVGGTSNTGGGAGIGGGYWGHGSNITINGGSVTAQGGHYGCAGIGGGSYGDGLNIAINGGRVTATGSMDGAGIGGGSGHHGTFITVNGGIVTAQGGAEAAGIGGGYNGAGANITINGGSVTATGGSSGAGIGAGYYGSSTNIFVADSVILKAGDLADPTEVIPHASSTTDISSSLAGKKYATATGSVGASTWKQVKAYLEAGVSVWLVADVTQDTSSVGINGKMVTLDLNGFTITGWAAGADRLLLLMNGANLTLTDGSDAKTGTIDGLGVNRDVYGGCVYVCSGCLFTMNGGMITNFVAVQGGAVYNDGAFVLNGGTIMGNTSTEYGGGVFITGGATMTFGAGEISYNTANGDIGGGGICSSGKLTMTGGTLIGNQSKDNPASTAIYSNLDDSDAIYGGVINGTIYRAEAGDLFISGGVFDRDQTSLLTSGQNCMRVGSNWIVGTDIACDGNNKLIGGTYMFCPTNTEYMAADVAIGEAVELRENEAAPKIWTLYLTRFLAMPTQIAHTTATVYTNNVLSAEISFGSGLWYAETNGTATVVYTAAEGYCFANGVKAATNTLDTTVNPAVNKGRLPVVWAWAFVDYVDEWGMERTTNACIIVSSSSRVIWETGWYAVMNDVAITGGADCSGAVNLILADGAKLTIRDVTDSKAGIAVSGGSNSFTVYGETEGTGALDVKGTGYAAGIGGGFKGDGANITINGGQVTATGGDSSGAGIGGGGSGAGSNITVNAGIVIATGGWGAAGIGGGMNGAGENITINGGKVTAAAGMWHNQGAGIGSGYGGSHTNIFVTNNMILKAGDEKDPTTVIPLTSLKTDVSSALAGYRYVTVEEWMVVCYSWARIKANLEAGNSVRLGGDVDQGELEGVDIWGKQTVMLDLNGFTLTRSTNNEEEIYRPFIVGPGHFTIMDMKGGGVVDGRGVTNLLEASLILIREGDSSFTLDGGTIIGFASYPAGGAVSVYSSFTMNGGTITNCSTEGYGGAVYNCGTITVNGGVLVGNSAECCGGAVWNERECTTTVNGGVFVGNSAAEDSSTALFGGNGTTTVNGGVSDNALIGDKKASGKTCVQIGDLYTVGTDVTGNVNDKLTGGTYTFCPTNAEYVAAGVAIADGAEVAEITGTPPTWMVNLPIVYPDYLAKYGAAVTNKFSAWAKFFGSSDPDGVYTNAFLLNVATNNQTAAEEVFAIGSIVVTNGVVDVELPEPLPPATSFNGVVWLQCVTNLPAADWKDVESGRYVDEKGAFLRCLIDFEHTLTPESFPTEPEGTKTIRVFAH